MKSITDITIRNYHIDHFGHVNHARYVELLEEARWRYLEENGLLAPIHETGTFHVVAKIEIDYRCSARIHNVLQIETRIHDRSDHNFRILQRATQKDSRNTALDAMVTNVFVDPKGRPRPIDGEILRIWPDLAGAPCTTTDLL